MRRATAVIDHTAIAANLDVIRTAASGADVMTVVKADAYGHGLVPVARTAREHGIGWLGVAFPFEALALREAGDAGRILAWLYAPDDDELASCLAADVDVSVGSLAMLDQVRDAAARAGVRARVHVKADTGLSRNGCTAADWPDLVSAVAKAQADGQIELVGVWSHLANADIPGDPSVVAQQVAFDAALAVVGEAGLVPQLRHLANSPATFLAPATHYDLVRCGIAAYGVSPAQPGFCAEHGLRAAMTLTARVAMVKEIPAAQSVSYGSTWTATAPTRLALVPVGYADGIPRVATGASVHINGGRHPVVGRVAMDQVVVALDGPESGNDGAVEVGDLVTVFGDAGTGAPTADDWGVASGSIGYEIVTRIGPRVIREHR